MSLLRRVSVDPLCVVYNEQPNSVLHTLVQCQFVAASREKAENPQVIGDFNSFMDWFQLIFQQHQGDINSKIAMICWMICKSKNELIWNQHSLGFVEVADSAFPVLNQWSSEDRTTDPFMGYIFHEDGSEHWNC